MAVEVTRRKFVSRGCGLVLGISTAQDPFTFATKEALNAVVPFYNNTNGKTPVSPVLAAEVTKGILFIGDSVIANSSPTAYTVTQAKNQNLNILNGGLYASSDPLLGAGNGTTAPFIASSVTRMGDNIITGGFAARVMLADIGAGGALVQDWAPGGGLYTNILVAFNRFAALGLPFNGIVFHAGPNDNTQGTSQANYAASLASMIAYIRTFTAVPVLIGVCSKANFVNSSGIEAAQTAAVNHPNNVWVGVNSDAYSNPNFQADGTHLSDTGSAQMATDYVTQLHAAGVI